MNANGNWTEFFGRLLGYEDVTSIESLRVMWGANWARSAAGPAWLVIGCLVLLALSSLFYLKTQRSGSRRVRWLLGGLRGLVLCLLLIILADPILEARLTREYPPLLWLVFDGTASMEIADHLSQSEWQKLSQSLDAEMLADAEARAPAQSATGTLTRQEIVRAWLTQQESDLFEDLSDRFRLQAYLFDGGQDGVHALELAETADGRLNTEALAEQLTATGHVTALGDTFEELALRHAVGNVAGMLVVSDFANNAGRLPMAGLEHFDPTFRVFTLGVGVPTAVDLATEVLAPPRMKKAEQSTVTVVVQQQELTGEVVTVELTARPLDGRAGAPGQVQLVGSREVTLDQPSVPVEFAYTPAQAGRFLFSAHVSELDGETIAENNSSEREVRVIDDFMRLLFVEQEPTWEWRFIKEVFHRDELVGIRGFKTFLRSADPSVKSSNEMFLPSLSLSRREFFETDVVFLGDIEGAKLNSRFCEMLQEFVSRFGGGLVVIAGPRFGPGELAGTPLADMLPVIVDPDARLRDREPFQIALQPMAAQFDFMNLGADAVENARAWENLGELPWYQPVKRLEPSTSTLLAAHPTDTCVDGTTPQPLIAIRRYGRGEVVYVAFNEMWRLRRKYGEQYYRQFWGQMIHRLGLSHALGDQKRFVARTDRDQYRSDETVLLTVEAFDADYEPLTEDHLPSRVLSGTLIPPESADAASTPQPLRISQLRPGVFEARFTVFQSGEYRVRVSDPVSGDDQEVQFQVRQVSAERLRAVRDVATQQAIAAATNGRSYEIDTIPEFLRDFQPPPIVETTIETFPLWSTWLVFGVVVLLLLTEWTVRKLVNLS